MHKYLANAPIALSKANNYALLFCCKLWFSTHFGEGLTCKSTIAVLPMYYRVAKQQLSGKEFALWRELFKEI